MFAHRRLLASLLAAVAFGVVSTRTARAQDELEVENDPSDDDASVFGLMIDAGVPDGVSASVTIRPWWWLRAHAGLSHNLVSTGLRGGVSLIPFDTWMTVALTAEAGHFGSGDANPIVEKLAGFEVADTALLSQVSYNWVNAHLGLEMGQEYMTFFVHGGMTYIAGEFGSGADALEGTTVRFTESPAFKGWVPSAKVGLIVYLF